MLELSKYYYTFNALCGMYVISDFHKYAELDAQKMCSIKNPESGLFIL